MEHNEFVEKSGGSGSVPVWGIRGFYRPVYLVWGLFGLLDALAVSLLVLTPAIGFVCYCVWSARYAALIWTFPMIRAFLSGRPNLNMIAGLPWILCIFIGMVCAFFFGRLYFVGGSLPFVTWVLSGAQKGMTMEEMEDELRESAETYKKLQESGTLLT